MQFYYAARPKRGLVDLGFFVAITELAYNKIKWT